ncbi:hypothetical protein CMT19_16735 [Elizabethkingia anophelis]|nr:hypothetical protein [Elizabethkingia anophelis]
MKKKEERKKYSPPQMEVMYIEMEEGIASGSASVNPGDIQNPNTPDIEDWNIVNGGEGSTEI